MKRYLDHSALPSAEEIKLYQQGKLTPDRTHEIELLAEENPMLGDALEGYAALPLFASVSGVTAAVTQQAAATTSATTQAAGGIKGLVTLAKTASPWWHLNGWIIGLGVGVSAAVITVAVKNDDNKEQAAVQPIVNNVETNSDNTVKEETKTTDYLSEVKAQKSIHKQRVSKSADNEQTPQHTPVLNEAEQDVAPLAQPTEILTAQDTPTNIEVIAVEENAKLKLNNSATMIGIGIVTIQNHRIADYTDWRRKNWKPLQPKDLDFPVNYADNQDKETDKADECLVSTPYLEYIDQCITAYNQKEYRTAIKGFTHILTQYSDDVNAQFYGAMSYYNHQQPVLALELLEKAEKNPISAFRQETLFYKAKCLKMLNRTDESSELFKQIVSKGGFYKKQAQKELND